MGILLVASIIILCAFLVLLRPDLINVLSDSYNNDRINLKLKGKRVNKKYILSLCLP